MVTQHERHGVSEHMQLDYLFKNILNQMKHQSAITAPLWWESTGDR